MPDTSASLYEQLNPLTTVAKQRFVENFSGDALDTDRWTSTNNNVGSNTFAMNDSVDGGFTITTGTTTSNIGQIDFNNKRQYEETGLVGIFVTKRATAGTQNDCGFKGDATDALSGNQTYRISNDTAFSNFRFNAGNASSAGGANSSVAIDTSYHSHKIISTGSDAKYSLDGVLEVTRTTTLPTVKQQPFLVVLTRDTSASTGHITYCEAYNT